MPQLSRKRSVQAPSKKIALRSPMLEYGKLQAIVEGILVHKDKGRRAIKLLKDFIPQV